MPRDRKSAADQVAEAKAKAAGIPHVKRTLDDLKDGKTYNTTNKPTEPPAKREPSVAQVELTGQPEAAPKASSVVSDRKKAANKANGQNSTGPRTPEGKARVSENALKHGLRSEKNPLDISTQIPGEQTQLTKLIQDFAASYQPNDHAELQLVIRLAQLTLRLNRAAQLETAVIDQARAEALAWAERFPDRYPAPVSQDFETQILANTQDATSKRLGLLSQYESRLSRDFARTLAQLRQSQKLSKQTQPALISKDEPLRPRHSGTGSGVPSDAEITSCTEAPHTRVDTGACPIGNPQAPSEPRSASEKFEQTNPTPPFRKPPSTPYVQDSGPNRLPIGEVGSDDSRPAI